MRQRLPVCPVTPLSAISAPDGVFTLSASAFQVLWAHLGLGDLPSALRVDPIGRAEHGRRAAIVGAWDELWDSGVVERDIPDPELERMLTLLAQPRRSVDAYLWLGMSVRALAASDGDRAVLGALIDGNFVVHSIAPDRLGSAAVGLLLAAAPGPGRPVSLPSTAVIELGDILGCSAMPFESELRAQGMSAAEVSWLAEMIDGTEDRGVFGATITDRAGRQHRADRLVGYFDTPRGRYLVEENRFGGGRSWVTVSPADSACLVRHIDQLLHTLAQRVD